MNKVSYWLSGLTGLFCFVALFSLYQTKQHTKLIQHNIAQVQKDILSANAHTAMLKMEWGVLNQPERLEALSKRFLPNLRPTETVQFAQLDTASSRLPATYADAKLDQKTMLALKEHHKSVSEGSSENIALARNNVSQIATSAVAHEEDGGLESAIHDLAQNETEKHLHALGKAAPSSKESSSLEKSYNKLLTAFQQNSDASMPRQL